MPSPLSFAVTYLYGEFPYWWIAVREIKAKSFELGYSIDSFDQLS